MKYSIFKHDKIIEETIGKNVLHIGACDAPYEIKAKTGDLLHQKINKTSKKVIGLDFDKKSITHLKNQYDINNIYFGDIIRGEFDDNITSQEYDVIVFGDVIEHLTNPGKALENLKQFMSKHTRLIITTPNVFCYNNLRVILGAEEKVHPDHTFWPSYKTLKKLIELSGYKLVYYEYLIDKSKEQFSDFKGRLYYQFLKIFKKQRTTLYFEIEKI